MFKNISKFLYPAVFPPKTDLGLLLLRFAGLMPLFLKHGIEKIVNFGYMSHNFPDPVGLGVFPTFIIAFISDVICSWLVMLGIATRWIALFMLCNLFVGWSLRHHFMFWVRANWHGEMMTVYMAVLLALVFLGPGKYSIDGIIQKQFDMAGKLKCFVAPVICAIVSIVGGQLLSARSTGLYLNESAIGKQMLYGLLLGVVVAAILWPRRASASRKTASHS